MGQKETVDVSHSSALIVLWCAVFPLSSCGYRDSHKHCGLLSGYFQRSYNEAWQQKYLKLYKTSAVNVRFWCQRLRIKERHFFLSRFTIFTGVTRREIHHSRGRDNSLSLTAASTDHHATPRRDMLHVRQRLQLFSACLSLLGSRSSRMVLWFKAASLERKRRRRKVQEKLINKFQYVFQLLESDRLCRWSAAHLSQCKKNCSHVPC